MLENLVSGGISQETLENAVRDRLYGECGLCRECVARILDIDAQLLPASTTPTCSCCYNSFAEVLTHGVPAIVEQLAGYDETAPLVSVGFSVPASMSLRDHAAMAHVAQTVASCTPTEQTGSSASMDSSNGDETRWCAIMSIFKGRGGELKGAIRDRIDAQLSRVMPQLRHDSSYGADKYPVATYKISVSLTEVASGTEEERFFIEGQDFKPLVAKRSRKRRRQEAADAMAAARTAARATPSVSSTPSTADAASSSRDNNNNNNNNDNDDESECSKSKAEGRLGTAVALKILEDLTPAQFAAKATGAGTMPLVPLQQLLVRRVGWTVDVERQSLYLVGRYNKYRRCISQTPWPFDDGHQTVTHSVQQLLGDPLRDACGASAAYAFMGAGREDLDVRMLGNGRPFACEMRDCHRARAFVEGDVAAVCATLQKRINGDAEPIGVRLRDLQVSTRADVARFLKDPNLERHKSYIAVVCTSFVVTEAMLARVNAMRNIVIRQWTPVRVVHRRPLLRRERTVLTINLQPCPSRTAAASTSTATSGPFFFILRVQTEAGTYIKELVHGDLGRTSPSLASLLLDSSTAHTSSSAKCDILSLDVGAVELSWPPSIPL